MGIGAPTANNLARMLPLGPENIDNSSQVESGFFGLLNFYQASRLNCQLGSAAVGFSEPQGRRSYL
jgi:hypothetical protein